jgi:hypothetical protein
MQKNGVGQQALTLMNFLVSHALDVRIELTVVLVVLHKRLVFGTQDVLLMERKRESVTRESVREEHQNIDTQTEKQIDISSK